MIIRVQLEMLKIMSTSCRLNWKMLLPMMLVTWMLIHHLVLLTMAIVCRAPACAKRVFFASGERKPSTSKHVLATLKKQVLSRAHSGPSHSLLSDSSEHHLGGLDESQEKFTKLPAGQGGGGLGGQAQSSSASSSISDHTAGGFGEGLDSFAKFLARKGGGGLSGRAHSSSAPSCSSDPPSGGLAEGPDKFTNFHVGQGGGDLGGTKDVFREVQALDSAAFHLAQVHVKMNLLAAAGAAGRDHGDIVQHAFEFGHAVPTRGIIFFSRSGNLTQKADR